MKISDIKLHMRSIECTRHKVELEVKPHCPECEKEFAQSQTPSDIKKEFEEKYVAKSDFKIVDNAHTEALVKIQLLEQKNAELNKMLLQHSARIHELADKLQNTEQKLQQERIKAIDECKIVYVCYTKHFGCQFATASFETADKWKSEFNYYEEIELK